MEKKVKVVMLTDVTKKSSIWTYKGRRLYHEQANFNDIDESEYFHIYLLSDDEIKTNDVVGGFGKKGNGDWCYNSRYKSKFKMIGDVTEFDFKIIATNDPELNLPNIPKEFIEYYVSEYNKGNVITEVVVEYEKELYSEEQNSGLWDTEDVLLSRIIPKIAPDNTITIRPVEETWHTVLENIFARNKNLRETESPEDFLETVANILSKEYNPPIKKK